MPFTREKQDFFKIAVVNPHDLKYLASLIQQGKNRERAKSISSLGDPLGDPRVSNL